MAGTTQPAEVQSAHTPGPWVVGRQRAVEAIVGRNGHYPICQVSVVNGDHATGNANAKLIAAAPDLLEELEQQADGTSTIISLLAGQTGPVVASLVGMLRFQEANARFAIAKATGSR